MSKLVFLFSLLFVRSAFSQVQVFPTRVTLTEETPSSYINLKNSTAQTQNFEIELVQFSMSKDGGMKKESPKNNLLVDVIKFSPKSAEVLPGEKQVVRIMATSFDSLSEGEYYIHLHFIPKGNAKSEKAASGGHSMSLQAKIAVAVPVVVRKGTGIFAGKIESPLAILNKKDDLQISFNILNGNKFFVYGDLEVFSVKNGKELSIDKVIGLSSYLPSREFKKVIPAKDWSQVTNGEKPVHIKLVFKSNEHSSAAFEQVLTSDVAMAEFNSLPNKKSNKRR